MIRYLSSKPDLAAPLHFAVSLRMPESRWSRLIRRFHGPFSTREPICKRTRRLWGVAASAVLLSALGWSLLSHQFQFGEGHSQRPIGMFMACYALGWAGLLLATWLLYGVRGRGPLLFILAIALLARALLLPSNLIQEHDVYRYLLDGHLTLQGDNPYAHTPDELAEIEVGPLAPELDRPEAKEVLQRIGYPSVRTLYPPLAQFFFSLGSRLGDWNWRGFRWLFLAVESLNILILIYLLTRMAIPPAWVLLYAWNPLVLKEVTNSLHVDVVVCLALLVAFSGFRIVDRNHGSTPGLLLASMGMAGAIAAKLYPLVLLPSSLLFLVRTAGIPRALSFLAITTVLMVGCYLPFADAGIQLLGEGLWIYATQWRMNEGFFAILTLLPQPRLISLILVAALSILVPLIRTSETSTGLLDDFLYVHLLWFLLIPSPFPWYALPLCALLPLSGGASGTAPAIMMLSGTVSLYYFSFLHEYRAYPAYWWSLIRSLEHGAIWICLLLPHWRKIVGRSS